MKAFFLITFAVGLLTVNDIPSRETGNRAAGILTARADAASVALATTTQDRSGAPPAPLYGINISGGEFGGGETGALIPKPDELDAYDAAGFNLFRIPFKSAQLDSALPKLRALAERCLRLKTPCIFDRHEYSWPSVPDQVAFVVKFDDAMPKSSLIQLDLMNEPRGFTGSNVWDQWAEDSQDIVTGIRRAGVTRRLWLEWPGSSATFRFDKGERAPKDCSSAACALLKLSGNTISDPLHRTGFEGHRYFDHNNSGSSSTCAQYVNIAQFAKAAVPFGMPVMIGEYAFGNGATVSPTCTTLAPSIMAEIAASPNLYGATAWGGGKTWKTNYLFRTPPDASSSYVRTLTGQ